jgi:DNA helicase-2/ATP-dependent DNA helicase PcrA
MQVGQEIRDKIIRELRGLLRPSQQAMADWQGSALAVSAVPGAGKSTGMAIASAIAIARFRLHRQRQLIIVTFTRAAAHNIRQKVRQYLEQWHLPASAFTVHTLHGLAYAIATSEPEWSGVSAQETILLSERRQFSLINQAVNDWIRDHHRDFLDLCERDNSSPEDTERLRRQQMLRTTILPELLKTTLSTAKSANLSPAQILQASTERSVLWLSAQLYATYNRLLSAQSVIDYEDMIIGAIKALGNERVRRSWQERTFAVFEDEAQDSSPLQTQLLQLLSYDPIADTYNLMRVGDANQAINSTFTNADPRFFNQFCDQCAQTGNLVTMDQAGRSSRSIMTSANRVLEWVNQSAYAKMEKPFRPQTIKPVPLGDPQPAANPEPLGRGVEIYPPDQIADMYAEVELIGKRIRQLYESDPSLNMAIIVRQRRQGSFILKQLATIFAETPIKLFDVEQTEHSSRVPKQLLTVLEFLHSPHVSIYLEQLLQLLGDRLPDKLAPLPDLSIYTSAPELFLYPTALDRQLMPLPPPAQAYAHLCAALLYARSHLPLYHLLPFIALTLNYNPSELATTDKLSQQLEQELQGNFHLEGILDSLRGIVDNSDRFESIDETQPADLFIQPRQVTVITYHKAKGLDWDVVFLPFVSAHLFPGELFPVPQDQKFFADYPPQEILRAQLRSLIHQEPIPEPAQAWERARMLKHSEEFRLLYVGMTRAKRLLHISCAQQLPKNWKNLRDWEYQRLCPALVDLLAETRVF